MKKVKVPMMTKVALAIAIIALVATTVSTIFLIKMGTYVDYTLSRRQTEDRGNINLIIDCMRGVKNACLPEVLEKKYK
jgi:hypothetical protein